MMELRADPIVDELRRLAPGVTVSGGSFAHWLPPPREVLPPHRAKLVERARREATHRCLTTLLASAGFPAIAPARLASGERDWPVGHVGSVSHKGTKVAAALVPAVLMRSLGIDVETRDGAEGLSAISGLTATSELPPNSGAAGPVLLFSVKEAAFKALYPILGRRLRFDEVTASWIDVCSFRWQGTARCGEVALDVRCSTAIPWWVVSVALAPPWASSAVCRRESHRSKPTGVV